MYSTLLLEFAGEVARITLNRPDKRNAISSEMIAELQSALDAIENTHTRVVILTGAGKAFCAGADIAGFASDIKARETPRMRSRDVREGREMLEFPHLVRAMSKPTIAAINGYALGIGITMALPCDIRVMAAEAKVGFIFARVGLMAELGSTYFLPRLVGASRATEMMLTGRHYVAAECLAMGLVSAVTPGAELLDHAHGIAGAISSGSPLSIEMIRRALFHSLDGTLGHAMEFENFALDRCSRSPEHKEYVSAFVEKRAPDLKRLRG
jgi:enoyl-CoA hydratase/carnithine racemase